MSCASSARADVAKIALAPVRVEPAVPKESAERIRKGLVSVLEGSVLGVNLEGTAIVQPDAGCAVPSCLASIATDAHADAVLVATVFQDLDVTSVTLVLFEPPDALYYESLPMSPDFEVTLSATMAKLLEAARVGPGPWLEVTTTPAHATIGVDGQVVGLSPYRGRISGGKHVLSASASGYRDLRVEIAVQGHANNLVRKSISLERATAAADAEDGLSKRRAILLVSIGSVLSAAGLLYGTSAAVSAARDGKCKSYATDDDQRYCSEYYDFSDGGWVQLSVSLALLGAGVPMLARGIVLLRPPAGHDHALSLTYRRVF